VNGLATATDAVLHGIQKGFEGDEYEPPIASRDTLGVVRVGHGFKVYSDGLIARSAEPFKLEPATDKTLGGIVADRNITVDEDGRIGIGSGAFSGTEQIKTADLAPGAVTTAKLATPAVEERNVDSTVVNKLKLPSQMWNTSQITEFCEEVVPYNARGVTFKFHRMSDKVAYVVARAFDHFTPGTDEGVGKTSKMVTLVDNQTSEMTPGLLGSGKATVQLKFLGKSSGGTFDQVVGYRTYILDFANATITQPADNLKLYDNDAKIPLFDGIRAVINNFTIVLE
jgi:hypothetical protein